MSDTSERLTAAALRPLADAPELRQAAMKMLDPEDVAWAILGILEAPVHVEIADILIRSAQQRM